MHPIFPFQWGLPQPWPPCTNLEPARLTGRSASERMQNLFILASFLATCNFFRDMQHGICWVLDPNTWLSPGTSATVSYLKWAYNPPLLSRHLHLLVAPTRATPCWIWGGLKLNTIISSPFRMSKLNLPVRYWLEANISQQVGPSLETHAEWEQRRQPSTWWHSDALSTWTTGELQPEACRLNMFETESIII